jgi:hypothetical protein
MPDPKTAIGGSLSAYVPDDATAIANGYTAVRFYTAATRTGSFALAGTDTLVAGTEDYSYNKTDALISDWFRWTLYGSGPDESAPSEAVPIGLPTISRKDVRQGVGLRLNLLEIVTATGASSTTFTAPELIDPDRSVHEVANRWARPSAGNYIGASRRVRAGSTGYVPATGTVTVARTFGGTLAATTEVELWQGRGSIDPSARVDQAMNRAVDTLWYEDTWYFSADDMNVSDFYLPAAVMREGIYSVEWASGTYPQYPGWRPVGWWDYVKDGGTPLLTVLRSAEGHAMYSRGTVLRIHYARTVGPMDVDADNWPIDFDWAVAETALEYLTGQLTPIGNKENLADIAAAAQQVERSALSLRAVHMPPPVRPRERGAR